MKNYRIVLQVPNYADCNNRSLIETRGKNVIPSGRCLARGWRAGHIRSLAWLFHENYHTYWTFHFSPPRTLTHKDVGKITLPRQTGHIGPQDKDSPSAVLEASWVFASFLFQTKTGWIAKTSNTTREQCYHLPQDRYREPCPLEVKRHLPQQKRSPILAMCLPPHPQMTSTNAANPKPRSVHIHGRKIVQVASVIQRFTI